MCAGAAEPICMPVYLPWPWQNAEVAAVPLSTVGEGAVFGVVLTSTTSGQQAAPDWQRASDRITARQE